LEHRTRLGFDPWTERLVTLAAEGPLPVFKFETAEVWGGEHAWDLVELRA
jgi:hypothetical protein